MANQFGPIHKIFGDNLREVRHSKNLTQPALAVECDMKATAISHFECGRRAPSAANLKALCRALHISADYLLGLPDNLPKSP